MPDEKAISLENLQTFKNNCDTAYESRKNIPTPTTNNNGQVLGVTNGAFAFLDQQGGSAGQDGKDALMYDGIVTIGGYPINTPTYSAPVANFNRTPENSESFLAVMRYTNTSSYESYYLGTLTVSNVFGGNVQGSVPSNVTLLTQLEFLGSELTSTTNVSVGFGGQTSVSRFNTWPSVNQIFNVKIRNSLSNVEFWCTCIVTNVLTSSAMVDYEVLSVAQLTNNAPVSVGSLISTLLEDTPAIGDTFTTLGTNFSRTPKLNEYCICTIRLAPTASFLTQAPYTVITQCTNISDASPAIYTMSVRGLYSLPSLHCKLVYSGNISIGGAITFNKSDFDRTPVEYETFEFFGTDNDNRCYSTLARITNISYETVSAYCISGYRYIESNIHSYTIVFNSTVSTGRIVATCQLPTTKSLTMTTASDFADVLEDLGFTAVSDLSNNDMFPANGYFKPSDGDTQFIVGFVVRSGLLYACVLNSNVSIIQQVEITSSTFITVHTT